jgi:hypothetical protein
MRVVLTRKLAECVDGIELSGWRVGDVLELPDQEASLLLAERWAIPDRRSINKAAPVERRRSQGPFDRD